MPPIDPRNYERIREHIAAARRRGERAIPEPEAKAILALCGIPAPRGAVATSVAEVGALAARLRPPLAVKVVSPDLLHKSDVGGIELNVTGKAEAEAAYERIVDRVRQRLPGATVRGVLVEEMVSGRVEVVASVTRDAQLGPVLMVGMGGLWVEILRDVSFRLVPVERADVLEMLDDLKAAPLLGGVRGGAAPDREGLVQALLRLSELGQRFSEDLHDVEINPLALSADGVCALDALIVLEDSA